VRRLRRELAWRPLPPTYLTLGLVVMGVVHLALSGPRLVYGAWRLAGLPIAAGGAWLTVAADALFKRAGTEVKPFMPSRVVVTDGPYRFSRHPMYLGFFAILAGVWVLLGTLAPLVVFGVVVWLLAAYFALPEERQMEEQFGDAYREYRARVRMWL
jgi:protein-S-isoprenylcysteine O-methyltransferase Ste14